MALIIKEVAVKETRTRTVDRRFSATEPAKECDVADCADNQREQSLNHQDEGSGSNPEPEEGSGGKKCISVATPEVVGGSSTTSSLSSTATTLIVSLVAVVVVAIVIAIVS